MDPIGQWRDDYRMASMESLITNIARSIHRDPKKGRARMTSPLDYMPDWDVTKDTEKPPDEEGYIWVWTDQGYEKRRVMSVEQQKRVLLGMAHASKGKKKPLKRKKK